MGSQTQHIDWAAAKKITLATSGGACIVIQAGKIDVIAPGTITVKAAMKDMIAAATVPYSMPLMPRKICEACLLKAAATGSALAAWGV
ncbi:MAG: DUF2345 domain-containing protein [Inhella sp.]